MNPRRRRLLIPGLLVALLVVVVVAALTDRAGAATGRPLVTIADSRITESSGLAVSAEFDDLAYTVNDSGNAAEVYAIDLTSGDVVGVTAVSAPFRDVEALALRDGTLWIGDLGDNRAERRDLTLYAIDEPGRETRTVDPRRYPVQLDGGPADVEALLADPDSDELLVVTKSLAATTVMSVDEADLDPDRAAVFRPVAGDLPAFVTDGAFSPDGTRVALLSYGSLWTVDPSDWSTLGRQELPPLAQAETVAFVDRSAVLVGSESEDSPLHRLELDPTSAEAQGPGTVATGSPESEPTEPSSEPSSAPVARDEDSRVALLGGAGMVGALALGGLVAWRLRARSSRLR
ncbi:hypothetical protein [Aeromicrobium sp.]|uniref:hypothetical protein n=1 Tax=Aeromicrobium sp. TaxID=1871063 RepID=UPI0028B1437F|nr:hypothetical protein [Aeromicrobium sp.]